jgi:hypothetical protein
MNAKLDVDCVIQRSASNKASISFTGFLQESECNSVDFSTFFEYIKPKYVLFHVKKRTFESLLFFYTASALIKII